MKRGALIVAVLGGCSFEVPPLEHVDASVAKSCVDKLKDQDETDVDCGGSICPKCLDGRKCNVNDDCAGGSCVGGTCATATCSDKMKNGTESDIDCGGSVCAKCMDGQTCNAPGDSVGGACIAGKCAAPSCGDKLRNQDETDIDCGGTVCPKCGPNQGCVKASDCTTGACNGGKCASTSCLDMAKNGAETDVDCGGGACPRCPAGKVCLLPSDCLSGVCQANKTCGDGLVAYWPFEEQQGDMTAKDLSGNGNDGTLMNGPQRVTGKVGNGLQFTNSYVNVPSSQSLTLTGPFTMSLWLTADDFNAFSTPIIKTTSQAWDDGYGMYIPSGAGSTLCGWETNYVKRACFLIGPAMTFRHIAVTYDLVNITFYLDGAPVAMTPMTGAVAASNGALFIGRGNGNFNWNGKIDEVRIFNRALTAPEIAMLFATP